MSDVSEARSNKKRELCPVCQSSFWTSDARRRPRSITITDEEVVGALLDALADYYSRKIVGSAIAYGKTVDEICFEERIPLSSCYRKVRQLVDRGLVIVEKRVITEDGKKYAVYRSTLSYLGMKMENGKVFADVTLNNDIGDKLNDKELMKRWKGEKSC